MGEMRFFHAPALLGFGQLALQVVVPGLRRIEGGLRGR